MHVFYEHVYVENKLRIHMHTSTHLMNIVGNRAFFFSEFKHVYLHAFQLRKTLFHTFFMIFVTQILSVSINEKNIKRI